MKPKRNQIRTRTERPSASSKKQPRKKRFERLKSETHQESNIETIPASILRSKKFPELQYAIDGYIVEGLTLLAGKPKIGKSWMALDFAIAVATGNPALGGIKCSQGPVLYCALEDNHRRLQRRMRKLYDRARNWPKDLHFATQVNRLDEGLVEDLEYWINSHNPRLIIIDTLAFVSSQIQRNGYKADYSALSPLQVLAGCQ